MADNVSYKYIHQSYSNKLKNKKNQIDISNINSFNSQKE